MSNILHSSEGIHLQRFAGSLEADLGASGIREAVNLCESAEKYAADAASRSVERSVVEALVLALFDAKIAPIVRGIDPPGPEFTDKRIVRLAVPLARWIFTHFTMSAYDRFRGN
ncbi:hypothetical protein [Kordiimonas sp.]|uniref:hypothetical protein n=1 Tax=Kordiimonas sp. TaxID=1970157 RepID=UPI003A8E3495